jgi:hypothetical protein
MFAPELRTDATREELAAASKGIKAASAAAATAEMTTRFVRVTTARVGVFRAVLNRDLRSAARLGQRPHA